MGAIDFHLLPFLSFYLITSNCEQSPLASLLGCDILWRGFYTMQSFMHFVGGNLWLKMKLWLLQMSMQPNFEGMFNVAVFICNKHDKIIICKLMMNWLKLDLQDDLDACLISHLGGIWWLILFLVKLYLMFLSKTFEISVIKVYKHPHNLELYQTETLVVSSVHYQTSCNILHYQFYVT